MNGNWTVAVLIHFLTITDSAGQVFEDEWSHTDVLCEELIQ